VDCKVATCVTVGIRKLVVARHSPAGAHRSRSVTSVQCAGKSMTSIVQGWTAYGAVARLLLMVNVGCHLTRNYGKYSRGDLK
jgi:hypothetical protein